jgi:hypothetical protein
VERFHIPDDGEPSVNRRALEAGVRWLQAYVQEGRSGLIVIPQRDNARLFLEEVLGWHPERTEDALKPRTPIQIIPGIGLWYLSGTNFTLPSDIDAAVLMFWGDSKMIDQVKKANPPAACYFPNTPPDLKDWLKLGSSTNLLEDENSQT